MGNLLYRTHSERKKNKAYRYFRVAVMRRDKLAHDSIHAGDGIGIHVRIDYDIGSIIEDRKECVI